MKHKTLVITPINHIKGVRESLESFSEVTLMDDPLLSDVLDVSHDYDAIYTNPNKSKVFLGKEVINASLNLKVIVTASTGTNHIDMEYAKEKNIKVLSLTEERKVIEKISSTAEHAFSLTMSSLRHVIKSHNDALNGNWDYTKYIGRQMDFLTIGIIGYGRLGSLYMKYCKAFGSEILVYDPYKVVKEEGVSQVNNLDYLIESSDVISLHVHVNAETTGIINKTLLKKMKGDVLIVNTSRGEVINEIDLVEFLRNNPNALFATDVLTNEIKNRLNSPLFMFAKTNDKQVTLTQHIGGMTREAQEIAYGHAANLLQKYLSDN
jgi:lactate dehydrogenase-like 2-hydroxyacid dehydrogenase